GQFLFAQSPSSSLPFSSRHPGCSFGTVVDGEIFFGYLAEVRELLVLLRDDWAGYRPPDSQLLIVPADAALILTDIEISALVADQRLLAGYAESVSETFRDIELSPISSRK